MLKKQSPATSIVNTLAMANAHFGRLKSVYFQELLSTLISALQVRRIAITSNFDRHDVV